MKSYRTILMLTISLACFLMLVLTACAGDPAVTTTGTTAVTTTNAITSTTAPVTTTPAATTTPAVTTAPPVAEGPYTLLSGTVRKSGASYKTTSGNVVLVINDQVVEGDSQFSVITNTSDESATGIIFGYTDVNGVKSYYRFHTDKSNVYLRKVSGKSATLVGSHFGAGRGAGEYNLRVIFSDGKAYCYARNRLFFTVELDYVGTKVGLAADGNGVIFLSPKINKSVTKPDTVDTLLFGHSYFDGWGNWAKDMQATIDEFDLGTATNIGIGGSQSGNWYKLKEAIAAYQPKLGIYMIGINDMSAGRTPEATVKDIEKTLLYVKEQLPDFEVVLLTVNHCPAKVSLKNNIIKTNELMRELAAEHDWIYIAEIENSFNNGDTPDATWFTSDGLHLVGKSYTDVIVPAIKKALRGEDQPV